MADTIAKASKRTIREAVERVLAGDVGGMFEADAGMSVEQACEYASRVAWERGAMDQVRLTIRGPWLHINAPSDPPVPRTS